MQTLNKSKKVKISVKKRRFKRLSMFELQNRADSGLWGNWVSKKNI